MIRSSTSLRQNNSIAYEMQDFGISLGVAEETQKYHLFVGLETSDFLIDAMNMQPNRPQVQFDVIFNLDSPAHDSFDAAYGADLKRGYRMTSALSDESIVIGSQTAAKTLLNQLADIAIELKSQVDMSCETRLRVNRVPLLFWKDKEIYNELCRKGTSPR